MRMLELYSGKVFGAIKGLDRIRFRGTLQLLANANGMRAFMSKAGVLLKDFRGWAERKTAEVRESCARAAEAKGIPLRYIERSGEDKERLARAVAGERGVKDGPICMFKVMEPCIAPAVYGDKESKRLELRMRPRKCLWMYHYFDHPVYGFGHVRLQTWLPLTVSVCLNGRHWLEKELKSRGVAYVKDGNCFPWVADIPAAQEIMDGQLRTNWEKLLTGLTLELCPDLRRIVSPLDLRYYWSADETEWATDVMFRSTEELDKLYPLLIRHGMLVADSPTVMRFLGKRATSSFGRGAIPAEILSDSRTRYEGVRNKHWINQNSVKAYNKCGSVLRLETTINNPHDFKVFRSPDDNPGKPASWQRMRKGVADLHRRCEVSDKSNERYADAVCCLKIGETLKNVVGEACNPVVKDGRRHRGINPWKTTDLRTLEFLARGELLINGFRNRDLRNWLFPEARGHRGDKEARRFAGKTTRTIRLLRAHGLIRKAPRVNRYVPTEKGLRMAASIKCASTVDVEKLMEMAA